MNTHQEFFDLFCHQDPELTFINRLENVEAEIAFKKFFKQKYSLIEIVKILISGAKIVNYSIYYNKELNDVRILKSQHENFHGSEKFIGIEHINHEVTDLQYHFDKLNSANTPEGYKYFLATLGNELESIKKIQTIHSRLTLQEVSF